MQDIKAILAKHADELSDETKEVISKAVLQNYRTIDEVEKKTERIKELEGTNKELTEKVGELEGDSDKITELQAVVDEFKAKEKQRKEADEENQRRETFRESFDKSLGERKFINDLMRDTVFDKVYKLCGEDSSIGVKEAIENVTKDVDGVWANPQQDPRKMPGTGIEKKTPEPSASKKIFAKQLFGSLNS